MFNACLFLSPFGSNYKVRGSNFRNNKWSDLFGMDNLSFSKVKLSINFEICFKVVFEWSNIILVLHTAADCIPNLIMYSQQCSNLSYRQNYCENLNRMHKNYHNPGLRPKPASLVLFSIPHLTVSTTITNLRAISRKSLPTLLRCDWSKNEWMYWIE